jgi:hypothetical protein
MCGPLISDCIQDKEKPMAVRASNILAARGMYSLMVLEALLLTDL